MSNKQIETTENHEKAMEAERVRQQPGMTAPTTWKPFEGLPKDGSRFLARLDEHQDITILHYEQVEFQDDGENYVPDKWITGWMPLPEWNS